MITLLITKQWKLIVLGTLITVLLWALTIGLAEVLWYVLKKYFDIDFLSDKNISKF